MEKCLNLNEENLIKIKRMSNEQEMDFSFFDLIDLFGKGIWSWDNKPNGRLTANRDGSFTLKTMNLLDIEESLIYKALKKTDYNQKKAGELLGLNPRQMNSRVRKFGIRHEKWRTNK